MLRSIVERKLYTVLLFKGFDGANNRVLQDCVEVISGHSLKLYDGMDTSCEFGTKSSMLNKVVGCENGVVIIGCMTEVCTKTDRLAEGCVFRIQHGFKAAKEDEGHVVSLETEFWSIILLIRWINDFSIVFDKFEEFVLDKQGIVRS